MKKSETLKKAISLWGKNAQIDIAIEELSELITAIQHFRRGKASRESVLSEIADVEIMCQQLKTIFEDSGEVEKIKEEKIAKLHKRFDISIKDATGKDSEKILEVTESATKTLRKTYRPKESLIRKSAETLPSQQRLVAIMDGKIVGTLRIYETIDSINLIGLGVHEDFRNRGVAKALIEAVENIAKEKKKSKISCRTIKETGNLPFFESCGFLIFNLR